MTEIQKLQSLVAEGKIRFATGEEQYELKAAFGDECDYTVNIFTGARTYFNYEPELLALIKGE